MSTSLKLSAFLHSIRLFTLNSKRPQKGRMYHVLGGHSVGWQGVEGQQIHIEPNGPLVEPNWCEVLLHGCLNTQENI